MLRRDRLRHGLVIGHGGRDARPRQRRCHAIHPHMRRQLRRQRGGQPLDRPLRRRKSPHDSQSPDRTATVENSTTPAPGDARSPSCAACTAIAAATAFNRNASTKSATVARFSGFITIDPTQNASPASSEPPRPHRRRQRRIVQHVRHRMGGPKLRLAKRRQASQRRAPPGAPPAPPAAGRSRCRSPPSPPPPPPVLASYAPYPAVQLWRASSSAQPPTRLLASRAGWGQCHGHAASSSAPARQILVGRPGAVRPFPPTQPPRPGRGAGDAHRNDRPRPRTRPRARLHLPPHPADHAGARTLVRTPPRSSRSTRSIWPTRPRCSPSCERHARHDHHRAADRPQSRPARVGRAPRRAPMPTAPTPADCSTPIPPARSPNSTCPGPWAGLGTGAAHLTRFLCPRDLPETA